MWVFTDTGFISAVVHHGDSNVIIVRARESESLDGIAALTDTSLLSTPDRDYPWRAHVPRELFQRWLTAAAADMQYGNFKNRIHETRGEEFYAALSQVWEVMHDIEERGR